MVAKSYQNLEIVGDVYNSQGRPYVKVRTKNGTLRQVRWYSEREYERMYPGERVIALEDKHHKTQKEIFGFDKGYITIFKGNTYEEKEYFHDNQARYTKFWGWYIMSNMDLPEDLPEDVEAVRLDWSLVGNEDGSLKSEAEIAAAVDSLIYEQDDSEYQGEIGDKLDLIVIVENAINLENQFGHSTLHVMRDYFGNCYVWTTAAKSWEVNSEHHIVGTVKDHRLYKGTKQTILTRCRSKD